MKLIGWIIQNKDMEAEEQGYGWKLEYQTWQNQCIFGLYCEID